ncbi:hypothetical protein RchiOBHm_Chr6g0282041 [Rosa chinensis]|uniref:Uncharacterized protein n=1 Tax=Rosa chinensis TaxID=74649 RepID=A0A2P6PTP6_ROSCH|nr:hypothetical protein RchiOBHm_Chr6g0282041 [Rosa chinensis]
MILLSISDSLLLIMGNGYLVNCFLVTVRNQVLRFLGFVVFIHCGLWVLAQLLKGFSN